MRCLCAYRKLTCHEVSLPLCCCSPRVRYELHGFTYLMEVLDLTLRNADERQRGLTDQEVDLCSEILKILFNLTTMVYKKSADEVGSLLLLFV